MSNRLSAIAWFLATVLAAIVVVGGVQTSSARFSGSTSNRSNLWQAAELSLEIGSADESGERSNTELFLSGEGLYPGLVLENCILVSAKTTVDQIKIRLHGRPISLSNDVASTDQTSRGDLSPYFNIGIELGSATGRGCANFRPDQRVFSGTLEQLTTDHQSFEDGLVLRFPPSKTAYLRFTGSVTDTNEAQDLDAEYTIHIEARP